MTSLWSYLPEVDESILDKNMATESAITLLWEDNPKVDVTKRNMKFAECGLMSEQKCGEFNSQYLHATQPIVVTTQP